MKKLPKDLLIYLITIAFNLGIGFLLTVIFSGANYSYFSTFTCGFVIISSLCIYLIANKLGLSLDIFTNNIDDEKHSLLTNIFIGNLFSIPLAMFVTLIIL